MSFTAKDVADLRNETGIGMMECKKALTEADGDKEKARQILKEKGLAVADKKASRIAADGVVDILSKDGIIAMVEVNSETDFVAKNEKFKVFVKGVLETIIDNKPADVAALLESKFAGSDDTVDAKLKDMTFQIGEKLDIRRFIIIEQPVTASYIHGGGSIGVIVYGDADVDKAEASAVLRNAALQVASMRPLYATKENVPAADVEAEKATILATIKNDPKNANKPDSILEKMVIGKLGKFYADKCLTEQEYVKAEDKETVAEYIAAEAKKLGGTITLKGFVCYEKGEGIEKREDDLAAEVAKLAGLSK